MPSIAYLPQWI